MGTHNRRRTPGCVRRWRRVNPKVRVARGPAMWARRGVLAAVLVAALVAPGRASSLQVQHCTGLRCTGPGSVLWTRPLAGSWFTQPGVSGTVTSPDGAFAASGGGVAVLGTGLAVTAISESTGRQIWRAALTEFAVSSAIVGVRAFAGVVAVGVEPSSGKATTRDEVILSAATGARVRTYRAAPYGGAVAATAASTVIVGQHKVTDYANATGRAIWSRPTGSAGQTWRVAGGDIYITGNSGTSAGAGAVPDLQQISLTDGAERTLHHPSGGFRGTLTEVVRSDLLFTGPDGVDVYNMAGRLLWSRASASVELTDAGRGVVYLASGSKLLGVGISSGVVGTWAPISVAASLYWVTGGVALGLDENGLGEAWGYDLATRKVVWSSSGVPWPHFFVDLSGLGGSASTGSDIVLLASCAQVGAARVANSAPVCVRPELTAVLITARSQA